MAKVSFVKPDGPSSMAQETQVVPAPATPASQVPAPYVPPTPPPAFRDDDNESFDPADLVLPRLNIVQKVGDLSNVFPPGSIVLGGALVLTGPGKEFTPSSPVRIVLVGLEDNQFIEKLEGGVRGNIFRSEAEVANAGGTLDWGESNATGKPWYQRSTTGLVLVEQPEGLDAAAFPHNIGGKNYALALYTMKGTAYTNAARHFRSAKKLGHLKGVGYRGGVWTFKSKLQKFGTNFAFIPVVTPAEGTTEEFRAAIKDLIGF